MVRRDYKMSKALIIRAVRNMTPSRAVRYEDPQECLAPAWADEEPEEVVGSNYVIRSVISDCKLRLM
jgi:hypothetical protein